jgi:hypothetical protein
MANALPALWTASEVARIAGGSVVGAWAATGVSLAPARCIEGDLFIDLGDGEAVPEAYARGAAACATHREIEGVPAWNHPNLAAGLAALAQAGLDRCGAVRIGVPDPALADVVASVAAIAGPSARLAARDEALAGLRPTLARAVAPVASEIEARRFAPHVLVLRGQADPGVLAGLPQGGLLITDADGLPAVQAQAASRGLEVLCWQATGEAATRAHARVVSLAPEVHQARLSLEVFGETLEVVLPAGLLRPATLEALLSATLALAVADMPARLSLPHLVAGLQARAEPQVSAPTLAALPIALAMDATPTGVFHAV